VYLWYISERIGIKRDVLANDRFRKDFALREHFGKKDFALREHFKKNVYRIY